MTVATSFSIGLSLSVDAFAASFAQGAGSRSSTWGRSLLIAACFAAFAAGFLWLGWALSAVVGSRFQSIDHWIAFILLTVVGFKMMRDAAAVNPAIRMDSLKRVVVLATTTSLDAAAVGMTIIVLDLPLMQTISLVAITSFFCTLIGFELGRLTSSRWPRRAEYLGGVILVLIGCKILLSHTLLH